MRLIRLLHVEELRLETAVLLQELLELSRVVFEVVRVRRVSMFARTSRGRAVGPVHTERKQKRDLITGNRTRTKLDLHILLNGKRRGSTNSCMI